VGREESKMLNFTNSQLERERQLERQRSGQTDHTDIHTDTQTITHADWNNTHVFLWKLYVTCILLY
jgi:hypothetical protein